MEKFPTILWKDRAQFLGIPQAVTAVHRAKSGSWINIHLLRDVSLLHEKCYIFEDTQTEKWFFSEWEKYLLVSVQDQKNKEISWITISSVFIFSFLQLLNENIKHADHLPM